MEFESLEKLEQKGAVRHRVRCKIGGKSSAFDLSSVIRIFVLPVGFPEGNYFDKSQFEGKAKQAQVRNFWNSQEAPGLAIFGESESFRGQLETQIRYAALSQLFRRDVITIGEAARIDFLSNDIYAHFVNIFEQFNKFPKTGTPDAKKVALCDWILLDGNNATSKLAGKEALIDSRSISIIELGLPRSQGKALESFTAELNDFRATNPQLQLNWNPPAGVRIWGWAK